MWYPCVAGKRLVRIVVHEPYQPCSVSGSVAVYSSSTARVMLSSGMIMGGRFKVSEVSKQRVFKLLYEYQTKPSPLP